MLLDINRHDGSVDRAVGSDSQGCVFKPHQGQNLFFFFFIYNMKSKKCSKKFKSRKIKRILLYP